MALSVLKQSQLIRLCFAITFFTSGVLVNLVQCLFYLLLRPLNKRLYRKINWYFCATIYAQLVFLGDWWSNSRLILYIDKDDFKKYYGKEHAYCVMNHTYEVDWLVGWMIANRIHLLGNCKAYSKKVIQYLPVLGWAWKCSEFVFLERSFNKDKDVISRQIKELADHPDPMWLLMFAEGTRFTPAKHKISLEFARKNNLPELKHHLLPRTRGFLASLPAMQNKVPAIYDILLAFNDDDDTRPTITNLLLGKPIVAHLYMNRIPMDNVPKTETEQEVFLRDMYIRKDKLKSSFIEHGDFFKSSGIQRVEPFEIEPRYNSIINTAVWFIVIMCPMAYYLIKLLFSGELLYFSIGASIITAFYVLLNKTIGMSEIKKGSSYGASTPTKDGA